MKKNRVVITGANGFIGIHITREMLRCGWRVACLARRGSSTANLAGLPVQLRRGDVRDAGSLFRAFQGADLVIHNAARAGDWGPYKAFYETNVLGTRNVMEACARRGIRNMIMTGSISVYGEESCLKAKDEQSPFNSHYPYFLDGLLASGMNHYRDTKALAEKLAVDFAAGHHLNLVILEPAWVYGEREFNTGFYSFLKAVKDGMRIAPGGRGNLFHVVYAGDLARAFALAARRHPKGVHRFIIGNPKAEPMAAIFDGFCRAAGVAPPRRIPKWLAYPAGLILEAAYTLLRRPEPPLLTRARVNMFYDSISYSGRLARRELGFVAATPLRRGIKKTVQWYLDTGHL